MPSRNDTTAPSAASSDYDALVEAAGSPRFEEEVRRLREAFQRRTGAFRADDPGPDVEARTRALWDDVLTTPGFAPRVAEAAGREGSPLVPALARAHRGLFVVASIDGGRAHLDDLWSGAELLVQVADDTQALALEHAEAPFDGRVVAVGASLHLLPGAFHHPLDATPHVTAVLDAARERGMATRDVLDALLRMERVLRTSSRVKAAYAYRASSLAPPPSTDVLHGAR